MYCGVPPPISLQIKHTVYPSAFLALANYIYDILTILIWKYCQINLGHDINLGYGNKKNTRQSQWNLSAPVSCMKNTQYIDVGRIFKKFPLTI